MGAELDPLLEIEGVSKSFGGLDAVRGATFGVAPGSVTALIGPNGAGKTTLFDILTGFCRGDAGSVRFDGHSIWGATPHVISRRGLVRTFQLTKTLSRMTVLDNVMLAAQEHPGERLRSLVLSRRRARRRERAATEQARELLERLSLARAADEYAGALSGGQRKLLELGRALMALPKLLLLDEPMAGVNPALGERLLDEMERLRREEHVTFLFVEHDMDAVMSRADHVVVMAGGAVIAQGPPDVIRHEQSVLDAYLGAPEGAPPC